MIPTNLAMSNFKGRPTNLMIEELQIFRAKRLQCRGMKVNMQIHLKFKRTTWLNEGIFLKNNNININHKFNYKNELLDDDLFTKKEKNAN